MCAFHYQRVEVMLSELGPPVHTGEVIRLHMGCLRKGLPSSDLKNHGKNKYNIT
jgi:hypothetical protein